MSTVEVLRARLLEKGPDALYGSGTADDPIPLGLPDESQPMQRSRHLEALGYDALSMERAGWAYVCLRGAAKEALDAGYEHDARQVLEAAEAVLLRFFGVYEDDGQALSDVRAWVHARLDPDSDPLVTMELRHTWTLRLLRTARAGHVLRFERLGQRFRLGIDDLAILRVLVAAHWDERLELARGGEPLDVGVLVSLLARDASERGRVLARLDPRAPLGRWGLVHVGAGGGLRRRSVEPDESVLAWVDGRRAWPWALAMLATPLITTGLGQAAYREHDLERIHRYVNRARKKPSGALRLRGASSRELRALVAQWSAETETPVVEVRSSIGLDIESARALLRETRLRSGVVLVGRAVAADWLPALQALGSHDVPVIVDDPGQGEGAVLQVRLPDAQQRLALWNECLVAEGLAELAPDQLSEALGPLELGAADMGAAIQQALTRASLESEVEPGHVPPDLIRECAGI